MMNIILAIKYCYSKLKFYPRIRAEKCFHWTVICFTILWIICYYLMNIPKENYILVTVPDDDYDWPGDKLPNGFLVYGTNCHIPDFDPLAENVMKLFSREKYHKCKNKKQLTYIVKNYTTDEVFLKYIPENRKYYGYMKNCCYEEISRARDGENSDLYFNLTNCVPFTKSVTLPSNSEFILIECKAYGLFNRNSYTNAYAIIRKRKEVIERFKKYENVKPEKTPLSILLLGIDSISRSNLLRAMPHTAQYLYTNRWFELQGYNKIEDNTFPNLMAILVGYNYTLITKTCDTSLGKKIENCRFLWDYYRENGYVTAYAEDEASINTFVVYRKGFDKPPTDHYFRPFLVAAEKYLPTKMKNWLTFCLGFKHSADYIYDYALDFVKTYKNNPFFGLFWTSSFSHNDISAPSSMDEKIKGYLDELEQNNILNTTMVIFFSDHGIRFGPVRQLETGWYEERLPFIFISLPKWFQNEHKTLIKNLKINRNRLTTPYDLHMTLKHVLELTGRTTKLPNAESCPLCQSLFYEIPFNRSCEDAKIESHWCTCTALRNTDKTTSTVKSAVNYILGIINSELQYHNNQTIEVCAKLLLKDIHFARRGLTTNSTNSYNDYLIKFETSPSDAIFESTIRYFVKDNKFEMVGSVSRLNSYEGQSNCIHDNYLKKYCYCII